VLYAPVLRFSIANPLVTAVVPVALLVITFGAMRGGLIKATFFPVIEHDNVQVTLEMRTGTPGRVTAETLALMEQRIRDVDEAFRQSEGGENGLVKARLPATSAPRVIRAGCGSPLSTAGSARSAASKPGTGSVMQSVPCPRPASSLSAEGDSGGCRFP